MRKFTDHVRLLITAPKVTLFYLVKIETPNDGTLLYTTSNTPIDIPGLGLFQEDSGLLIVEPPRLSSAIDREAYKITFVDPTFQKRLLFETGLTGAKVTVYAGFYNSFEYPFVGILPGQPVNILDDLIIVYSGAVDTQGYSIDPEEGTVIAVIECSSPMASLGLMNIFYTSKDAMRQRNPIDTSFDSVFIGVGKAAFKWGKK